MGLLNLARRKDVSLSQSVAVDRYQIKREEWAIADVISGFYRCC